MASAGAELTTVAFTDHRLAVLRGAGRVYVNTVRSAGVDDVIGWLEVHAVDYLVVVDPQRSSLFVTSRPYRGPGSAGSTPTSGVVAAIGAAFMLKKGLQTRVSEGWASMNTKLAKGAAT